MFAKVKFKGNETLDKAGKDFSTLKKNEMQEHSQRFSHLGGQFIRHAHAHPHMDIYIIIFFKIVQCIDLHYTWMIP